MRPVVAIDGPAGAGKSSVSRALAARLGFTYIDSGAMYRAVGVLAHEQGVPFDDDAELARLVDALRFEATPDGTGLAVNGRDLSDTIRRADAGDLASRVSTRPVVRERLVALQRRLGEGGGVVMEGRDIGTVVFPDAQVKVFLVADPRERAHRRAAELRARGEAVDEAAMATDIAARDQRDQSRAVAPLRPAPDAVTIDTTPLSLPEVVERLVALVHERTAGGPV